MITSSARPETRNMKKVDVYSLPAADIDDARQWIEEAFVLQIEPHESDYHGGAYYRFTDRDSGLVLQENFLDDDGERAERKFPDATILLYVNAEAAQAAEYAKRLKAKVQSVVLLRSDDY